MVLKMPHDDQYGPILLNICPVICDWRIIPSSFQYSDENVYNFQAKCTCFSKATEIFQKKILREIYMLVVWQGYFNGILPARKIKEYLWIMQNMFKKGFLFTFCFFHWLTSENKHDFTIQSRAQHTQYNLLHQNSRRFFYGEEVCKSKVMCFRCSYHVPQRFVT